MFKTMDPLFDRCAVQPSRFSSIDTHGEHYLNWPRNTCSSSRETMFNYSSTSTLSPQSQRDKIRSWIFLLSLSSTRTKARTKKLVDQIRRTTSTTMTTTTKGYRVRMQSTVNRSDPDSVLTSWLCCALGSATS